MRSQWYNRQVLVLMLAFVCSSMVAHALPPAKGKVILTITGNVGDTNAPKAAVFDLSMIEQLPQQTFSAMTPWDKKPIQFTGPLLRDVLAAYASGEHPLTA